MSSSSGVGAERRNSPPAMKAAMAPPPPTGGELFETEQEVKVMEEGEESAAGLSVTVPALLVM